MENQLVGVLRGGGVGSLVPRPKVSVGTCHALRGGGSSFFCCPLACCAGSPAQELPRLAQGS